MGADGVANITAEVEITVDAADFAGFMLTANEGDADDVQEVWGDFELEIVPVDEFDNPSVKVFAVDPKVVADSLKLLDVEMAKAASKNFNYTDGIEVEFDTRPRNLSDDLPISPEIPLSGYTADLIAPDDRRNLSIEVLVVNESLMDDDTRSVNIKSDRAFDIRRSSDACAYALARR